MSATTGTTATPPWTVSLDRVRDAVLSIFPDPDALDFTCAAIMAGAPSREAGLIGEFIFESQRRAYGCIR